VKDLAWSVAAHSVDAGESRRAAKNKVSIDDVGEQWPLLCGRTGELAKQEKEEGTLFGSGRCDERLMPEKLRICRRRAGELQAVDSL
jgi:hypothetical protein